MKQSSKGQVFIEFALILPVFFLVLFCIVQTAVLFNAQYLVTYSSFCGCRAAIVHADPLKKDLPDIFAKEASRLALASSLNLSSQAAKVDCEYMRTEYRVTVTMFVKNIVPGFNLIAPVFPVQASTRLPIE